MDVTRGNVSIASYRRMDGFVLKLLFRSLYDPASKTCVANRWHRLLEHKFTPDEEGKKEAQALVDALASVEERGRIEKATQEYKLGEMAVEIFYDPWPLNADTPFGIFISGFSLDLPSWPEHAQDHVTEATLRLRRQEVMELVTELAEYFYTKLRPII